MDNPQTQKEKVRTGLWKLCTEGLWLDALWTFLIYWRWWIKGFFIFWLLSIPVSYFSHNFQELLTGSHPKHSGQELWQGLDLIISFVQMYFFIGCFLNQEPIVSAIKSGLAKRFFLFLKAFVFVIGASFATAVIIMVAPVWLSTLIPYPSLLTSSWVKYGRICIGLMCFLYIFTRLSLALPLAVNGAESPIKQSWHLTDKKWPRMALNLTILSLLFLWPLLFITIIWTVAAIYLASISTNNNVISVGLAIISSANGILYNGVLAAFLCVTCRKLYQEDVVARLGVDRRTSQRS